MINYKRIDNINSRNLPIFVINLDSDISRWNSMKYQLDFINSNKYQRISAVDMRKPDMKNFYKDDRVSLYTKFTIQKKHRCDHKQIDRTGAIGATLSHFNIWKKIIDEKIDMAIILEDDMELVTDFFNSISIEIEKYNKEFDILNIGYIKRAFSDVDNSKFYFGAGCYIVTKEACEILCKYVFPIDTHVDAFFFLLNHFGYLKMILSDKDLTIPTGNFKTNIDHGEIKCMRQNNDNRIINKITTVKQTEIKSTFEYTKNIFCILAIFFIILVILTKMYFIIKIETIKLKQ